MLKIICIALIQRMLQYVARILGLWSILYTLWKGTFCDKFFWQRYYDDFTWGKFYKELSGICRPIIDFEVRKFMQIQQSDEQNQSELTEIFEIPILWRKSFVTKEDLESYSYSLRRENICSNILVTNWITS